MTWREETKEAAARKVYERMPGEGEWESAPADVRAFYLTYAEAALAAVEERMSREWRLAIAGGSIVSPTSTVRPDTRHMDKAFAEAVTQSRLVSPWQPVKEDESEPPIRCEAVLFHGPGHQSKTPCRLTGVHEVHEAVYSGSTFATWRGDEAMTGVFDEPPEEDESDGR